MKSPAQKLLARLQKMSPDRVIDAARRTKGLEVCVWESPAHLLLGLACLADNSDCARSLLTRHPHLLNTPCAPEVMIDVLGQYGDKGVFDGMTPLQAAASQGSFRVGQYLLSCPGINVGQWNGPIDGDERRNWTALFQSTWIASYRESLARAAPFLRFAQMLLDHGADPFDPDADSCSPFSIALLSLSAIEEENEALDNFQVAVSLVEMCCPHLPELGKNPAHKDAIHDITDSLVRLMEEPMDSPESVWFQSHSGLALPLGEALMATLLTRGLAHPACLALQDKFPAAFALIEKKTLEERIGEGTTLVPTPSRRL
jgi:hypothetical protein